jgi:hypothetical protein
MRFALGFVIGLIAGFFLTLVIWVRIMVPYGPVGHGVNALAAPALVQAGLFFVAPLGGLALGVALGFLFRKRIP